MLLKVTKLVKRKYHKKDHKEPSHDFKESFLCKKKMSIMSLILKNFVLNFLAMIYEGFGNFRKTFLSSDSVYSFSVQ